MKVWRSSGALAARRPAARKRLCRRARRSRRARCTRCRRSRRRHRLLCGIRLRCSATTLSRRHYVSNNWRTCRTPPGSEEASLSARTPLTSRSLHSLSSLASPSPSPLRHSPTLQRDDTMYSVTSGESTPVLLECEVSRCKSSDNVGAKAPTTPPPSRSSDNVNTMEGVEACVGGSIVGITPGAALTSNQLSDAILY
ncbi:hypothetical protein ACJJTC_014604 [Scirpophaga incertulas]